jgi:hypothetical protein
MLALTMIVAILFVGMVLSILVNILAYAFAWVIAVLIFGGLGWWIWKVYKTPA